MWRLQNDWMRVGRALLLVGLLVSNGSWAQDVRNLFPAQEMQDEETLDLEIIEVTSFPSRLKPRRSFERIRFEFTSFQWAGETWRHKASLLIPDRPIPARYAGAVAIVSQTSSLDRCATKLAEISPLLGIPCLVVESANPGARYGQSTAGEVMQHGMEQFLATRDPNWIAYNQLAKVIVRSVTAASALAKTRGTHIDRAVVTGHSKRGLGAWIACAVDDRIVGAMPTGYLLGNMSAFFKHKLRRWGPDYLPFEVSRGPASLTTAQQIELAEQPGWSAYQQFVDPYRFQDLYAGKKVLNTIGALDPLYPVTYAPEWTQEMSEIPMSQLVVSGYGHGNSSEQHHDAWAMWLAHSLGNRPLSRVSFTFHREGRRLVVSAHTGSPHALEKVTFCYATGKRASFLPTETVWKRKVMTQVGPSSYRIELPYPRNGHAIGFVELRDRDADRIPGVVTSRLQEITP